MCELLICLDFLKVNFCAVQLGNSLQMQMYFQLSLNSLGGGKRQLEIDLHLQPSQMKNKFSFL